MELRKKRPIVLDIFGFVLVLSLSLLFSWARANVPEFSLVEKLDRYILDTEANKPRVHAKKVKIRGRFLVLEPSTAHRKLKNQNKKLKIKLEKI